MESNAEASFHVGEVVLHTLFKYRGVVCDVDPVFQFDRRMVRNDGPLKAPKDEPWYRVLVDGEVHATYVAQRNLKPDGTNLPIVHPPAQRPFFRVRRLCVRIM